MVAVVVAVAVAAVVVAVVAAVAVVTAAARHHRTLVRASESVEVYPGYGFKNPSIHYL